MRTGPQFRHAMIRYIRERSLVGFTSNADIAAALRADFDMGITDQHVNRWRKAEPAFDLACTYARQEIHGELVMAAVDAARQGDMHMVRWLLERTCNTFMPKSRTDLNANVGSLDELLANRMSDDAAREKGLLYDEE